MTTANPELIAGYRPLPGGWDEMVDAQGQVRPAWSGVTPALEDLGHEELLRRRQEASRLLDDDGVTYNVYGSEEGRSHRWQLDPLPVVLTSDEWATIERGVVQRAELLDLVLADLYGQRDLLRRGLLPPALVLGHPGFLRACDGIRLPGSRQLFSAAIDLARAADGTVCVLADRTQAPSGAGYALENRAVTSRVLPGLYRDAQVHRLAPFFRALRSALQAAAPPSTSDPRIVVLTPGSLSETAFEHAFLASYLGYPLVEGSDLVMRDSRIWMRSLGRLEAVDVILRRVDATFADPLELYPQSQLGIPGLTEACRLGTVSVVNTLGSGVLENPALQAFLPALAERLLGQPLRLPSVPTWWCGVDDDRRYVLERLRTLVLRRTSRVGAPIFGWELSDAAHDELRDQIAARPAEWVGQEPVALGSVPTVTEHGLESRRSVLRAFVVARGESYLALPGGLTRVAADAGSSNVSNQRGGVSKDTWVLASEPEKASSFWLQGGPAVSAVEPEASMSARAAENLFWLGRYAERAEGITRLLRVVHGRRNEFAPGANPAGDECVAALLTTLTHLTVTYPGFVGDGGQRLADPAAELVSLVIDADRPGTLAHAVNRMLDTAYAVRDQLSNDTWMVVGGLDRDFLALARRRTIGRGTLDRVMHTLLALAGLAGESMVRDPGWRFMDAGRRIERGIQLAALLRSLLDQERDTAADSLLLESLLTSAESIISYRRRYRSHAQVETVLDLLLLDEDNPRALAYQVARLAEDVDKLPVRAGGSRQLSDAGRRVLEASTALRLTHTSRLAASDDEGRRVELATFLFGVERSLAAVSDAITAHHFAVQLPQRSLVRPDTPLDPDDLDMVLA